MRAYEVEVKLNVALTVVVGAQSEDGAEDLAHEAATVALAAMDAGLMSRGCFMTIKEGGRDISRIGVVKGAA